MINSAEIDPIRDTDGKDDFTEGYTPRTKLLKADVSKEAIDYYESIFRHDTTFWERLGNFIRAENRAGRKAKILKDFALTFVPYGRQISNMSELATEIIEPKSNTYNMSTESKSTTKSKTVITFGLLFLVGLLQILGVDIGLELSTDAQWVTTGAGFVGVILRLLTDRPVKLGEALGLTRSRIGD